MNARPATALLSILALTLPALGDKFIMTDGTTLEGKILRQDAEKYFVEVSVTKSIKDERTIAKKDVAKIEQEKPDLIAFEQLRKLVPTPDLLTADEYAQRIRTLEKFLTDYPASSKLADAKEILATVKTEANEILAGGLKMYGKILAAEDYRANAYEIDSRIQEMKIRGLAKQGRYLQALRAFNDFGRDFSNTAAYADLVPLATQLINAYLADIGASLTSYDARIKEREAGLKRMSASDSAETANAIREETAGIEARFKAEQDAKVGWVNTDPYFKPSLEETVNFGKQELTRLAALPKAPAVDAGKIYREALATLQAGTDSSAATTIINNAKAALIPPRYIAILEKAARAGGSIK